MGKRHRKGKGRFLKTNDVDDVLDEQMIDTSPYENKRITDCGNLNKGVKQQFKNAGKVNRTLRRNERRKNNAKQKKNIIQKGILFANLDDEKFFKKEKNHSSDLRTILNAKKVSL